MSEMFDAYVLEGQGPAVLRQLSDQDLPDGDVTVDVSYSSLNYKDGLALTGRGKIARRFPMVCGIDLAGTVADSQSPDWHAGDEVIVTGWGLSETRPGGFTRRQRVQSDMLVRKPDGLSLAQAMAIGTAGLTAMLCVLALERAGLEPGRGPVVVTGAAGGVGSVAVAVLAGLGYEAHASTGRPAAHEYLRGLGAAGFVDRADLAEGSKRPLEPERWAGGVDTVGSSTLATVLKQTRYGGSVAACGLAGGSDLPVTVLPFILRGVSLLGVDSVMAPAGLRAEAWRRLGTDLPAGMLDAITSVRGFSELPDLAEQILAGATQGRIVIDCGR
jgi:putative YhdH/YhfP family quinone oxidoreductase